MRHKLNTDGISAPSMNNSRGVVAGAASTGGNNFVSCNVNGSNCDGIVFDISSNLAGSN